MIKRCLLALLATAMLGVAQAQAPKPATDEPDPKIFQDIFICLAPGLVQGWAKAWITVVELDRTDDGKSRNYEAIFRYSLKPEDKEGEVLVPCDAGKIIKSIGDLNEYLKPEQRRWVEATLTFTSDGKYEVKYDYVPPAKPSAKPAAEKAGAKPAAKPAAKAGAKPVPEKPAAEKPAARPPDEPKKPGFKLGQ